MRSTERLALAPAADSVPESAGCFGFAVRSPLPLHYLRAGGREVLELEESASAEVGAGDLLFEWLPRPDRPLARLFQDGRRYRFWVDRMGAFIIDPVTLTIVLPRSGDPIQREERLWGWPATLCFLHRGDLALHAAAADVGGDAVLLCAPGRFGKSTLATAFHLAGHRVLSEDLTCVRWGTPASVLPGPAMLRIRKDMMTRLTLRGAHVIRDDTQRCSVALDADRRGTCDPVRLRAAVLLRESDGGVRMERVPFTVALPDLWSLSFHLPSPESRARCFSAIVELAKQVPTWNLFRPLSHEDLPETVDRIIDDCLR